MVLKLSLVTNTLKRRKKKLLRSSNSQRIIEGLRGV
jgi:hypothetical protein